MMKSSVKCVIIGDGAVGKTCMLIAYATNAFDDKYVPTVFENYSVEVNIRSETVEVILCDTSGQEEYDRLRPLAYPKTDIFLICCSIDNPESFENAKGRWLEELRHYCPSAPFMLVGTQQDKRNTQPDCMSFRQGERIAKEMGALKYMECSAKAKYNVKNVIKEAIIIGMDPPKPQATRKRQCSIL